MPDAPKWTVTEWADDCHPEEARWFVHRDNAWYSLVVGARTWSGFADLAELQEAHPRLRPVDVDNVAALLADFHDLDAELAKTVSNFEEFAEAAAEERQRLTAELAALAPGWESPAALQAAYSEILALCEATEAERDREYRRAEGWADQYNRVARQIADLRDERDTAIEEAKAARKDARESQADAWAEVEKRDRALETVTAERDQARRDAASWEDWGRGWKTQAEANQVERDKAWAELDRLRPVVEAARAVWTCPIGEAEPHLAAMFDAINELTAGTEPARRP